MRTPQLRPETPLPGPGNLTLGTLGACDPRLANALIRPDRLGVGDPTCGWAWEIINITGRFNDTSAEQQVRAQINDGIPQSDLWVREVTYTVERPEAFAGNIFKAQSDYYNSENPNIDFTLEIDSHCRYLISPDPTPLQNIRQVFSCVCPVGFVLGCSANILATFVNKRTLAADEVPTRAVITLHAIRLPTRYDSCALDYAVSALESAGILPCLPGPGPELNE